MVHYKATVEYDGSDFAGFQRQPTARTVQGELEGVLATLQGGQRVTTIRGAGRTDSGVHATGQVVDFHLDWPKDDIALQRALNALLPGDLAVRALERAPEGFHPRYDAVSRGYIYTILNSPWRQPLLRHLSLYEPRPLDESAMDSAVRRLLGEHDFASFGRANNPGESTTRVLLVARVWREEQLVRVELEANGFLYRMVRSIVGCLLVIGRGEAPLRWIEDVLDARDRDVAAQVAGPEGLCLVRVRYPDVPQGEAVFPLS